MKQKNTNNEIFLPLKGVGYFCDLNQNNFPARISYFVFCVFFKIIISSIIIFCLLFFTGTPFYKCMALRACDWIVQSLPGIFPGIIVLVFPTHINLNITHRVIMSTV